MGVFEVLPVAVRDLARGLLVFHLAVDHDDHHEEESNKEHWPEPLDLNEHRQGVRNEPKRHRTEERQCDNHYAKREHDAENPCHQDKEQQQSEHQADEQCEAEGVPAVELLPVCLQIEDAVRVAQHQNATVDEQLYDESEHGRPAFICRCASYEL